MDNKPISDEEIQLRRENRIKEQRERKHKRTREFIAIVRGMSPESRSSIDGLCQSLAFEFDEDWSKRDCDFVFDRLVYAFVAGQKSVKKEQESP